MTVLLDGRAVAEKIKNELKKETAKLGFKPGLAAVLVGDDPASKMYVGMKEKACNKVGFNSLRRDAIKSLNDDEGVHGVIVQLPLPDRIDTLKVFNSIAKEKDVDGFHPGNMGELMAGNESLVAATPKGVVRLLEEYKVPFEGKEVVMVNHSVVVGKPLAMLFLNRLSTVTVCHVKTRDLGSHTLRADILVSATGRPHLIKADMVADNAVVVDVGISHKGGKTVGDVDFENVKNKCSHITPVPGGVGPMTIAALLENTLAAVKETD